MKSFNTLHLINKVFANSVKRLTQPRLFIGYSSFWAMLFAANLNAQAPTCSPGTNLATVFTAAAAVNATTGSIGSSTNALGVADGTLASIAANSSLTLDMGTTLNPGDNLFFRYNSSAVSAPMQVLVSTVAGGPFTNILQLIPNTTTSTTQFVLPLSARFIRLVTDAQAFNLDAVYKTDYSCQPDNIPTCTASQFLTSYKSGLMSTGATTGTVSSNANLTGVNDGLTTSIAANSSFIADYGTSLAAGTALTVFYTGPVANPLNVQVSNSAGGPFIDIAQLAGTAAATTGDVILPIAARYVKFVTTASAYTIDAATYKNYVCVTNPIPSCAVGQTLINYAQGAQSVSGQTGTPTNPLNAVEEIDGDYANIGASQSITLDFGASVAAGNTLSLRYNSNANINPLQILVATLMGGPYTNIAQVPANATVNTYPIVLPQAARYVQMVTNAGGGNYNVDALTLAQYVCVTPVAPVCADPAVGAQTETGATAVTTTSGTVSSSANALGLFNGTDAAVAANSSLTLDMGSSIAIGNRIKLYYNSGSVNAPIQLLVATASGGPYTNIAQLPGSTTKTSVTVLLPLNARYIQLQTRSVAYNIDALTLVSEVCVTEPAPTCASGEILSSYKQGAQAVSGTSVGTVSTPANALQPINGTTANMAANSEFTVDMGSSMPAGTRLSVTYIGGSTSAPLQISVATSAGGPFTNVKQLDAVTATTTNSFLLPIAGQFVRFNTTTVNYNIDAITFPVSACVPSQVPTCSGGQQLTKYNLGLSNTGTVVGAVSSPANLLGTVNATETTFNPSTSLVVNYDAVLPAGTVLTFTYRTHAIAISPMFVWASTTAGGPFTNIAQLEPSTTTTTANVTLPANTQYLRLENNASLFYYIDAITSPVYNCITPPPASTCASGQVSASYPVGLSAATQTVATVSTPANAIGTLNSTTANMSGNAEMSANFATVLPAGTVLSFTYIAGSVAAPLQVLVSTAAGGPFTNIAQLPGSTSTVTNTVTLPISAQFLKLQTTATNYNIDAITYLENVCVATTIPTCAANQVQTSYPTGVASVFATTGSVTTSSGIVGTINGVNAVVSVNSSLTADMGSLLAAGTEVTLNYVANSTAGYLQVEVAATSGGAYTNISQIIGVTTATTGTFTLPFAAQFIRLTTGPAVTFTLDAMTYLNYVCVANPVSACAVSEILVNYTAGLATVNSVTGTVSTQTSITGVGDGNTATFSANAVLTADFGSVLPAGTVLTFRYSSGGGTAPMHVSTSSVAATGPFTEVHQIPVSGTTINYTYTLPFATQYLRLSTDAVSFVVDAVTYPINVCVTNPVVACATGETQVSYPVGISSVVGVPTGATNPLNLLGTLDGANVNLAANGQITGDLGMSYPAGAVLTINYNANALTAPLQFSVATATGGPYTNIAQIPASTTVTSATVRLPFTARYIRLNTTGVVFNIDAITRLEYVCVPEPNTSCATTETQISALNGIASIDATTGSIGTSGNMVGIKDGLTTSIAANSTITANIGQTLAAGTTLTVHYTASATTAPLQVYIATALAGPFTEIAQIPGSTTATTATFTLTANTQFIRLSSTSVSYTVDAITYTDYDCITAVAQTCPPGFRSSTFPAGASAVVTSTGTVSTSANATGTWNGTTASISTASSLTLDLGATVNAGEALTVYYSTNTTNGQFQVLGSTVSGGPFTHLGYVLGSTTATTKQFTLKANVRYVQLVAIGLTLTLDAVTYTRYECVPYDGIAGCVFYDANNNGTNDAELGIGGITVKIYDASNALVATALTSYGVPALLIPAGYFEVADLVQGAYYRVEYELSTASGLFPSAEGTSNNTSVQFIRGGTPNNCFGVYQPSLFCSVLENPRVVGATGSIGNTNATFSWRYYDRSINALGTAVPPSLTKDVKYTQTGAIWGIGSQRGTNLIYAGAMTSDMGGFFPSSPDGPDAIYVLNYNSANGLQDYVDYKHLVNLSDLGIDVSTQNPTRSSSVYTFGEVGLGGLDISDDGKFMYIMNMGNGKLIKVDISGVDYNNLPATKPTSAVEIPIPAAYTQCGPDVFRPTLVKNYNNKIYVGGVCDGTTSGNGNLGAKILTYDPATGNWAQVMSFPLNFTTGGINTSGAPQTRWNDFTSSSNQPVFSDLVFDSDGSMSLGFVNRFVLILAYTSQQAGYMLRTYLDANGNQRLENNGIAGTRTTLYTGGAQAAADGPGTNWFYQQSSLSPTHPYTFNGGLFQKTGEPHVVAGVVDPNNLFTSGGTYYNVNTGIQEYNIQSDGNPSKVARITGGEQVCEAVPEIEIGNRVWSDLNGNGIQDANDSGIRNVTIELYADLDENGVPDGTALATTTTAADGTWYFNASNVPDGDPSPSSSQAGLLPGTGYIVRVGSSDWAAGIGTGDLLGFTMTLSNIGGAGQPNVRDNDAILPASNIPTIALKTGAPGENNHTYDMGFICLQPSGITLVPTSASCSGATVNNDGTISLNAVTNATRYGVSSLNPSGGLYDGPVAMAATVIPGTLPTVVQSGIPSTGGTYVVRIFNGSNDCYIDITVVVAPISIITNPSAAQAFCVGATGGDITVNTNQNAANSIRFVRFTTDQIAGSSPTSTETNSIYAGTVVATVTPTGGAAPYTATLTTAAANWSSAAPGTYYVYAILNPDPGGLCRPIAEIVVTVNTLPSVTQNITNITCFGGNNGAIDITASGGGGTYTYDWADIAGSNNIEDRTGLVAGTYSVTVTDVNNCTVNAAIPVTEAAAIVVTATPGACVRVPNTYTVTGTVTFSAPPTTGTLTVQVVGGGSQVFSAPFTSPIAYTIASQSSDGALHTVTATFSATSCVGSVGYTAPVSCACPTGVCGPSTMVKN